MATKTQDQQEEKNIKTAMIRDRLTGEIEYLKKYQGSNCLILLQNALLSLRRSQYVNRYGDYLKLIPICIRVVPYKAPPHGHQDFTIGEYWEHAAKTLQAEDEVHEREMRRGYIYGHIRQRGIVSLMHACSSLGISHELALWSIMEFGADISPLYQNLGLGDLRKNGEYSTLAKILYHDQVELDKVSSEEDSETGIIALENLIQEEIDTWFHCIVPDDPETWVPTTALLEVARKERERRFQEHAQIRQAARKSGPNQANIGKPRVSDLQVSTRREAQIRAAIQELATERAFLLTRLDEIGQEGGMLLEHLD